MRSNRILDAIAAGRPAFGTYATGRSTNFIEILGYAGLDYVRLDMDNIFNNPETLRNMIHTAHAVGITPIVRVPSLPNDVIDEGLINRILEMGAMGIIVPRATDRSYVEAAVRAVKGPPLGDRHVSAGGFSGGYGQLSHQEHLEWANKNILVSVQLETKHAIDHIDEIVSVPGLDMLQSGRNDLSYQYGVPGQQYHPLVLEAERKMIEAGLKAGKIIGVHYHPLKDPTHIERLREMRRLGVQVHNLGDDSDLVAVYRRLLQDLNAD